jgi:hypothetical protein
MSRRLDSRQNSPSIPNSIALSLPNRLNYLRDGNSLGAKGTHDRVIHINENYHGYTSDWKNSANRGRKVLQPIVNYPDPMSSPMETLDQDSGFTSHGFNQIDLDRRIRDRR